MIPTLRGTIFYPDVRVIRMRQLILTVEVARAFMLPAPKIRQ
jgi:hypothetical protein